MLEYCLCPKCERMIMLDSDFADGFCLYCGTHIAYSEAREDLLTGLRAAVPDEFVIHASVASQMKRYRLDAEGMLEVISEKNDG